MARLTGRTRYQRMLSEEPPPTPTPGPVATEERPFVHLYPDAPRYGPYQRRDDPDKGYNTPFDSDLSPAGERIKLILAGHGDRKKYKWRGDPDKGYGMDGAPHWSHSTRGAPPQPPWPSDPNLPDPGPKITMAEEEKISRGAKDVEIRLKEIARWFGLAEPWWPPWAWRVKGE